MAASVAVLAPSGRPSSPAQPRTITPHINEKLTIAAILLLRNLKSRTIAGELVYPIRFGFAEAVSRIETLLENGHDAEAFVTTVFTVEKTLRRTLRQIIISAGFASPMATKIVDNLKEFRPKADAWELYDPAKRKLTEIVSQDDWRVFTEASKMRKKLVHGVRVYGAFVGPQQSLGVCWRRLQ